MEELKESGLNKIVQLQQVRIVWSDGRTGIFTGPAVFKTVDEMVESTVNLRINDVTFSPPYDFDTEKGELVNEGDKIPDISGEENLDLEQTETNLPEGSDDVLPVQIAVPTIIESSDQERG